MEMKEYELLAKLVQEYYKEKRPIDTKYIDRIANIIISKEQLENYLERIEFYQTTAPKEMGQSFMQYNSFYKRIRIQYALIMKSSKEIPFFLKGKVDEDLFSYFFFNKRLFHELGHALENKIYTENPETLFAMLFLYPFREKKRKILNTDDHFTKLKLRWLMAYEQMVYRNLYEYNLEERIANIFAYKTSSEVAKVLENPLLANYGHFMELEFTTFYPKGKSPTLHYLKRVCLPSELREMKEKIARLNLSEEERLYLGLDVSRDALNRVLTKKEELKRTFV